LAKAQRDRLRNSGITSVCPKDPTCPKEYYYTVFGRKDIEDALKRLGELTQEEALMVMGENL
jgi:hypothetical protein